MPRVVYPNSVDDTYPETVMLENTGSLFINSLHLPKAHWRQNLGSEVCFALCKILRSPINNGLYPSSQLDTVDSIPVTADQTNLSLVSAIGLNAYSAVTGNSIYTQAAKNFANEIYTCGLGIEQL